MAYLLAYTKKGEGCYPDFNYPGHVGYNCDWEQAMHLAISEDGKNFTPLYIIRSIFLIITTAWSANFFFRQLHKNRLTVMNKIC